MAVGAALLSAALLAALAVIATVSDQDALATVALALSILSFSSQLVIFAIQTWTSTAQLKQAETLNRETVALLAEARARIASTERMMAEQHAELRTLNLAKTDRAPLNGLGGDGDGAGLGGSDRSVEVGTTPEALGHPDGQVPVSIEPPVADEHRQVDAAPSGEFLASSPAPSFPIASLIGDAAFEQMGEWPPLDQIRWSVELLEALPDAALANLKFAVDEAAFGYLRLENAVPTGLTYNRSDDALLRAGIVIDGTPRRLQASSPTDRTVRLSDLGREVSRVLVADWPPPTGLDADVIERLWSLRQRSGVGSHDELFERNAGT